MSDVTATTGDQAAAVVEDGFYCPACGRRYVVAGQCAVRHKPTALVALPTATGEETMAEGEAALDPVKPTAEAETTVEEPAVDEPATAPAAAVKVAAPPAPVKPVEAPAAGQSVALAAAHQALTDALNLVTSARTALEKYLAR